MTGKSKNWLFLFIGLIVFQGPVYPEVVPEQELLSAMQRISSHELFYYVSELCTEKFGGRLTGTPGYNDSAQWVIGLLQAWGIKPAGNQGTYIQEFPNPYTLVLPGSEVILHIPYEKGVFIYKPYRYETDFLPGSTSDTGQATAEVIYVGYGISAPELNFDEYAGLDVRGKIVLVEREVPISPENEAEEFKKWRPYSFHQYKVKNAREHGAAGMVYNYPIANPNCEFQPGLIVTYVGDTIVNDLFLGTGRDHGQVVEKIAKERIPQSFFTGKTMTIKNFTQHHPEGTGWNVLGMIEGSDPSLKQEAVVLSAHLDHLGYNHELMPGANDNASGVAVILGVAKALSKSPIKPRRTVIFAFFGAEEQGVKGAEYFLAQPTFPQEKIFACLNLDGVGRGSKLTGLAGKNYPQLWKPFDQANQKYIHRVLTPTYFHNRARPRLDAAHFMWAGIPTISFNAYDAEPLPYPTYHVTADKPEIITPEIMEDLAQLIFLVLMSF